jgi:TRAP transporter TAXI family solute receptor
MTDRNSTTGGLSAIALVAWTALAALTIPAGMAAAAGDTTADRVNRGVVEIVTGSSFGSSPRITEDLAAVLDDGSTRRIVPVVGKGSFQNLIDLKALRGIDLAIVQADVLDEARAQKLVPGLESSITYVAKLYNEEFHLVARDDIARAEDLAGKKVNFGVEGDGASFTASRVFSSLNIKVDATSYDPALALQKLKAGEIQAIAYVTAKPAPLFATVQPKDGLHLLAIPLQSKLASVYIPARLTAEDYPGLTQGPVDTVAVGTVMVAANFVPGSMRYRNVANFVDAFFTQFSKFQEAPRHPKWNDVNLAAELPNWRRFPQADAWIKQNGGAAMVMNEQDMRRIFADFLDQRSSITGGQAMTATQKDDLFNQFKQWQSSRVQ